MYQKVLSPEKGKRIWGCMSHYAVSILANSLDRNIEPIFFEYVINFPAGIYYYGYNKSVRTLPETFASVKTSAYLRMIKLLTTYSNKNCMDKLYFIKEWLESNKIDDNIWDLGKASKDNILFPLSDTWRKDEYRIQDCTYIIKELIENIG